MQGFASDEVLTRGRRGFEHKTLPIRIIMRLLPRFPRFLRNGRHCQRVHASVEYGPPEYSRALCLTKCSPRR